MNKPVNSDAVDRFEYKYLIFALHQNDFGYH